MMLKGIRSAWTWRRALYLSLGTLMIVQSALNAMWAGVLFGAWFAAMGLFAFGCAGGQCGIDSSRAENKMIGSDTGEIKT